MARDSLEENLGMLLGSEGTCLLLPFERGIALTGLGVSGSEDCLDDDDEPDGERGGGVEAGTRWDVRPRIRFRGGGGDCESSRFTIAPVVGGTSTTTLVSSRDRGAALLLATMGSTCLGGGLQSGGFS